ncbi:MAG TPA: AraC family transcriptional regulator [Burkholderiales bacterium]|nr:AraC family transcriptional regulator [Burkholderiales bacterium]
MTKPHGERIRTYALAERAAHPDFSIHDERTRSRIEQAHRHEYFQVQLNLAGRTRQQIGAAERALEPGSLSFVLPYRVHRIPHPTGSRFYVISFTQRFLRPELDVDPLDLEDVALSRAPELAPFQYQAFLDFNLKGAELDRAENACCEMAGEAARRGFASAELIRGNLLSLLGLVCRRYETQLLELACGPAQTASRRDTLARVGRYIRENLAHHPSLADAAAAAVLSPNYLAHLISKETGKTFTALVTERRMAEACELLTHTGMRVSEIARAVGFDDEAYFARRFRQWFGVSPSGYRKNPGQTRV